MESNRWPLHPQPREFELILTWTKRLAEAYEISTQLFFKKVLHLSKDEASNITKVIPESAVRILSTGTGVSNSEIRSMATNQTFKKIAITIEECDRENPGEIEKIISRLRLSSQKG